MKIPHSPATVSSDEIPTVPLSLSKLGKARESRQRPANTDAKTAKSGDLPKAINVHLFRRGFGRVTDLANIAFSCFSRPVAKYGVDFSGNPGLFGDTGTVEQIRVRLICRSKPLRF